MRNYILQTCWAYPAEIKRVYDREWGRITNIPSLIMLGFCARWIKGESRENVKWQKKRRGKNVKLVSLLFVIVVIVGFFSFVATGFHIFLALFSFYVMPRSLLFTFLPFALSHTHTNLMKWKQIYTQVLSVCVCVCICLSGRVFGKYGWVGAWQMEKKDIQATGSSRQRPWPHFLLDGREDFDCDCHCYCYCYRETTGRMSNVPICFSI